MGLVGRLTLGLLGLALAIPCGTLALCAFVALDPVSHDALMRLGLAGLLTGLTDLASGIGPEAVLLLLASLARGLFVLLVVPPVTAALIGAVLSARGIVFHACGTGLLTALVPWLARGMPRTGATAQTLAAEARITAILFLAGAASGLVYALVAARGTPAPLEGD